MARLSQLSTDQNLPTYQEYIRASLRSTLILIKGGRYREACKHLAELTDNFNYGGLYKLTIKLHEKIQDYYDSLKQADIESWAWHLCSVGTAYNINNRFNEARDVLEEMKLLGEITCDEDIESTAIHNIGITMFYLGERSEAKDLYERAAVIKMRIGDQRGLSQLQNNLASIAIEEGRLDEAQVLVDSSLAIKRRLRDSEGLCAAYGTLGDLAVARSEYRKAKIHFSRALQIAKRNTNPEDVALSYLNLGNVLLEIGNVDDSLQHYRNGLDIAEKWGLKYAEEMLLQAFAVAYNHIGDYGESLVYFCKLAQIKKLLHKRFDEALAYHDAAVVSVQAGNISEGIDYYNKAIKTFKSAGNPEWQARSLKEMASAMADAGMENECHAAMRRCLLVLTRNQILEELKDAYFVGCHNYFKMGRIGWALKLFCKEQTFLKEYYEPADLAYRLTEVADLCLNYCTPSRAVKFFDKALCIYQQLKDHTLAALVRNDLGRAYMENGQINKAIVEFNCLVERSDKLHDRVLKLLALTNLAEAKRQIDDLKSAIELGKQCIEIGYQINDLIGLVIVLNNLGLAYESVGDIKNARICFKQSSRIAHQQHDAIAEARALSSLGTMDFRRRNYEKALVIYEKALALVEEDNSLKLDLLENCFLCLLALENEQEASKTAESILSVANKYCDYARAERVALKIVLANLESCSLEAAAKALVISMIYAMQRGSKALTENFTNWVVLLRDTDNTQYSREELYNAIKTAVNEMIPNHANTILDPLANTMESFKESQ